MSKTTRVSVPKGVGDQIQISYSGDDPVTYKVHDGHVSVENEKVDRFLAAVPGASPEGGKSDAGTAGDGK